MTLQLLKPFAVHGRRKLKKLCSILPDSTGIELILGYIDADKILKRSPRS
jgi:hypothetical protein